MGRLARLCLLIAIAALPTIVSADGSVPAAAAALESATSRPTTTRAETFAPPGVFLTPGQVASFKSTNPWPTLPAGAFVTADGWFPPVNPKIPPPPLPKEITKAFVIPIHEEITPKTYEAVERKINRCREQGAQLVIFDMNTPGGRGDAMEGIVRLILEDNKDIHTVAYVDPRAFSAGAVISLACNEIVVSPAGVIGDAMPILISAEGALVAMPPDERKKMESGARAIVRTIAQNRGHSEILCEGMITISIEVWLVRDRTTRELRLVDGAAERGKVWQGPPTSQPGESQGPPNAQWEFVAVIDGPNSLATLTGEEALRAGLSRYMAGSMTDLKKHYNIVAPPVVMEDTWSELMVEFLTSTAVAGILFGLGIFLAYMELNAPGHFVPGILAAICFAIFFGSRYLIGLSDWWQIALFVVGLTLIIVELLTFHTVGLLLIAGVVCCIAALLGVLVPHMPGTLPVPQNEMDWSIFRGGAMALGLGFIGAAIAAMAFARFLPRLPIAGKLILQSVVVPSEPPVSAAGAIKEIAVGEIGVAETLCRPVGKVRFGDRLLNATSTGEIIQPGERVKVLKRDENRIIVEKA
jgi:membrane-bound serine protease (ClpP class)